MRKSRTEPSLGSFATYQSSEAGCSGSADPGNDTSDFDNEIYQITPPEYPGIALPNDLMSFLNIPQMNSELDLPLANGIETQQQNAAQNTLKVCFDAFFAVRIDSFYSTDVCVLQKMEFQFI
jgi:hypothetical protein